DELAQLVARYALRNTTDEPRTYTLALAIRPLQVNPPTQFLSTVGGVSRIDDISIDSFVAEVNGRPRVFARQPPDAAFASSFDAGMAAPLLHDGVRPQTRTARDPDGLASGALLYEIVLAPGEQHEVDLLVPLIGDMPLKSNQWDPAAWQARTAQAWRERLDLV